jgi:hypothetical protein
MPELVDDEGQSSHPDNLIGTEAPVPVRRNDGVEIDPSTYWPQWAPADSKRTVRAPPRFDDANAVDAHEVNKVEDVWLMEVEVNEDQQVNGVTVIHMSESRIASLEGEELEFWRDAIVKELSRIQDSIGKVPAGETVGEKPIYGRLILALKRYADADESTPKARYVILGHRELKGVHYHETYAPVVSHVSLRILIAIGVAYRQRLKHTDVEMAYLNSHASPPCYTRLPSFWNKFLPDSPFQSGEMVVVVASIYGRHASGREWYQEQDSHLQANGYKPGIHEPNIYIYEDDAGARGAVGLFTDDYIHGRIFGEEDEGEHFKQTMSKKYRIKDFGELRTMLGIDVQYTGDHSAVFLSQRELVMECWGIVGEHAHRRSSYTVPMDVNGADICKESDLLDTELRGVYVTVVGKLLYVCKNTRPDVCFAVGILARCNRKPTVHNFATLVRLCKYLADTVDTGLQYKYAPRDGPHKVTVWADASFGDCIETGRSTGGYLIFVDHCLVDWRSKRSQSVCLSTVQAELHHLVEAVRQGLWVQAVLGEIVGEDLVEKVVVCKTDSKSLVDSLKAGRPSDRARQYRVELNMMQEWLARGDITVDHVPGSEQLADAMTKALARPQFKAIRDALMHTEMPVIPE